MSEEIIIDVKNGPFNLLEPQRERSQSILIGVIISSTFVVLVLACIRSFFTNIFLANRT